VAALLGDVLGRAPSPDEARTVHRETGGNPLFVTQVGRLLATGSATVLPTGVRDVLARRLARVSAPCDQVLGAAAVVGTEFDVAVVAAVLGGRAETVLAALDEAAAARLVAPVGSSPDRWTFVHALVRTARYEIGVSGGSVNAEILRFVLGMFVALDRRDATGLEAEWAEALEKHPELFQQENAAALAPFIDARFGRADRARAELARVGHEVLERLPRDQEWLTAISQFLVAGVVSGEDSIVRRSYELLVPYAGLGVFDGVAAVDHGVVDRFLALAAGCLGDVDAARRHVEVALVASAGSGRLVVAHTRTDCARALLYSTHERDLDRGRQLARAASEDYETLGLASLVGEMRALVADRDESPAGSCYAGRGPRL
jgi:hypothetical protein